MSRRLRNKGGAIFDPTVTPGDKPGTLFPLSNDLSADGGDEELEPPDESIEEEDELDDPDVVTSVDGRRRSGGGVISDGVSSDFWFATEGDPSHQSDDPSTDEQPPSATPPRK